MQITTITGNAWALASANCHGNNKGGLPLSRRGKLNISLEFSWRPRDVIITQKPTHQQFARYASHSCSLVEGSKCISYSGEGHFGGWVGGKEQYREGDGVGEREWGKILKSGERDESRKQGMGEDRDGERREGIMRGKEEENDSPYLQTTPCW